MDEKKANEVVEMAAENGMEKTDLQSEQKLYCSGCGTLLQEGQLYCSKCGKKVEYNTEKNTSDEKQKRKKKLDKKDLTNEAKPKKKLKIVRNIILIIIAIIVVYFVAIMIHDTKKYEALIQGDEWFYVDDEKMEYLKFDDGVFTDCTKYKGEDADIYVGTYKVNINKITYKIGDYEEEMLITKDEDTGETIIYRVNGNGEKYWR